MKTLLSANAIQQSVASLAAQIERDYEGQPLTIVGVLTGSLMILADLIRHIDMPLRVGLIQASSYRGRTTESDSLQIGARMLTDLAGRHVLLVDDIFDTGRTLAAVLEELGHENVASLRTAVFLWKEGRQVVDILPDYHCFKIPNVFVVGYGLDYDDEFRNLPFVAELEESER